ncbi:hypothetical protein SEA_SHAM_261 [Streptomyces phage Sham]|nr:hypothetical protein SEA_SHAM_2 [Streptomyces phage Sham]UUG69561.1 hypothetical protein SEA_SHAM_261 [Streptomyces phage Sham]
MDIPKEIEETPAQNSPDVNRGKAIAASAGAIVVGGGLSALTIAVVTLVGLFFVCLFWGIGVALTAL